MSEAALFQVLLWSCFGAAAVTALSTSIVTAPYGRYLRSGWGPTIPGTTGWILMEAPAAGTLAVCFFLGRTPHAATEIAFLGLWELHYLHRTLVYPLRRAASAKPMPLLVMCLGMTFNVLNGYLNGRYLFWLGPVRASSWFGDPRFVFGAPIFFAGLAANLSSDEILLRLRRPGEAGYFIPEGGLFRWITCPSYLGEIVEWSGFALLTWSPAALAFAAYTASNLVPRAMAHHRWYRATFPDYPPERRAILPFVL